jgi:ethanolamine utilization protein EutN
MLLCKVKGNIVSTQKNKNLISHKLMLVHPVDLKLNLLGIDDFIAIDLIGSGTGDIVMVTREGDAVQQILGHKNAPVNTIIVAIVDDLDISELSGK